MEIVRNVCKEYIVVTVEDLEEGGVNSKGVEGLWFKSHMAVLTGVAEWHFPTLTVVGPRFDALRPRYSLFDLQGAQPKKHTSICPS